MDLETAQQSVSKWKEDYQKVVFTNGVFDLLHMGHITYLSDAAALGNKLIIGLNADESVKTLAKGPARPIKDEKSRAFILAALEFVDAVVIFNDHTPAQLIDTLVPNVLVKGGDYNPEETNPQSKKYIVGREIVLANGGEVKVIDFLPGHSTTALEQKIITANS
jgi:D-beta-D-heptose 7-phosphate kinase/D-beta-D-heptose 1-phosphate adenosyltransferase